MRISILWEKVDLKQITAGFLNRHTSAIMVQFLTKMKCLAASSGTSARPLIAAHNELCTEDIATTVPFLEKVLETPEFADGRVGKRIPEHVYTQALLRESPVRGCR